MWPWMYWPWPLQGADRIAELVRRSAGRIAVLAGGGVVPDNAAELLQLTGVAEIHSSAKWCGAGWKHYARRRG